MAYQSKITQAKNRVNYGDTSDFGSLALVSQVVIMCLSYNQAELQELLSHPEGSYLELLTLHIAISWKGLVPLR